MNRISLIEDNILRAQIAKQDEKFEKYDINKICDFMHTLLSDIALFYEKSDLNQKNSLLGSIFPLAINWSYPGISNLTISAVYQAAMTANNKEVFSGAPSGTMFEPI